MFLFPPIIHVKVFAYFKVKKNAFCKLDITKIPIFAVDIKNIRDRTQQEFTI